ncbi:MAG: hypothetical protein Q8876_06885, partial [Bacillota bacterium]|nr:hypothetical protein [Bacillota bacterium]
YFNYMQGHFSSDAEFMNFIYNIRVRSQFNIPIDVNEHDQLLTLSTCSYEFPETRTVVVARRIRAGESSTVDVSKATLNSNPLYPTEKYKEDGGTPPKVTDFQTALAAGQINWYDGGGKVSGSQTLVPNNQPATTPVTKPKVQATNPPIQTPTSAPVIQKATTAPKPAATNPPTKAATTPVQKTTNPPTATKPAG